MKTKTLLSTVFLLGWVVSLAQPTLTENNSTPAIYTILNYNSGEAEVNDDAGEDMTWDNSDVFGIPAASYTVIDPSWTPFSKDYNDSNWALADDVTTIFYNSADSGLVYYGGVENGSVIYYSDPLVYFQFPFTYGDTWEDEYSGNFNLTGIDWERSGTVTAEADAWGSLELPSGVYEDCLRVHVVETLNDTSDIISYNIVFDYHFYHHPETGFWIFQTGSGTYEDSDGQQDSFVFTVFLESMGVSVEQAAAEQIELEVYPNPANDVLNLSNGFSRKAYQILTTDGRLMSSGIITNNQLNISHLEAGTYILSVIGKNDLHSKTFIKN